MEKNAFLDHQEVRDFINWSAENLPNLNVSLQIKRSRFVPNRVSRNCIGLDEVLRYYVWKTTSMNTGDWDEAVAILTTLAEELRNAVDARNNEDALKACKAILTWGGDRNCKVGAYPFLREQPNLCDYIRETGDIFILKNADEAKLAKPNFRVGLMNSMLTKVHALFSQDGLPIYDSRVAAAIASLVELWRYNTGQANAPLPIPLSFPATMTTRTVLNLYPTAHHPGVMIYGDTKTVARWSSAKVRLGWLMEEILDRSSNLFAQVDNRMHAFEASLFMIGYDVTCLGDQNTQIINKTSEKSVKKLQKTLRRSAFPISAPLKTLPSLSGRGQEIKYKGDVQHGFHIQWGQQKFFLEPSLLEELVSEFGERKNVPLGAERRGSGPIESLGVWLKNEHKISPQFASAIAPILTDIGLVCSYKGKSPILLNFV